MSGPGPGAPPPRGLSPRARRCWTALAAPAAPAAGPDLFDPSRLEGLPTPVRRWLSRAIAPGAPLARSAELAMHGTIRIGRWQPFRGRQVIAPGGYIWAARAGRPPVVTRGFDLYAEGEGEMRWRLFGLVPVMSARGPDVARSAAGRLAGELMILNPAAALAPGVAWSAIDDRRAIADVPAGPWMHRVTVEIDEGGRPCAAWFPRWGAPGGGPHAEHRFGALLTGELASGGYTIPARVRAGWWLGEERWAEGEFFRAVIDGARFR